MCQLRMLSDSEQNLAELKIALLNSNDIWIADNWDEPISASRISIEPLRQHIKRHDNSILFIEITSNTLNPIWNEQLKGIIITQTKIIPIEDNVNAREARPGNVTSKLSVVLPPRNGEYVVSKVTRSPPNNWRQG